VELVYQMGQALGRECQQMGVGILLGRDQYSPYAAGRTRL
jgi:hypothetical protein